MLRTFQGPPVQGPPTMMMTNATAAAPAYRRKIPAINKPKNVKRPGTAAAAQERPLLVAARRVLQTAYAETREPGVSVPMVAQRYNLNANQVFRWRRLFREPAGDVGVGRFVPIVVEAARGPAK